MEKDNKEKSKVTKPRSLKTYKGIAIQSFKISGKSYKKDDVYKTTKKTTFDTLVERELIIK